MSNHTFTAPFMQPVGNMHAYPGPHMPHHQHHQHQHANHFCNSCRHPVSKCACHRSCRKIEKELLVRPKATSDATDATTGSALHGATTEAVHYKISAMMDLTSPAETPETKTKTKTKSAESAPLISSVQRLQQLVTRKQVAAGMESTVIGGGCCVHLSIEYMPLNPLVDLTAFSGAMVIDSESTVMLWGKYFNGDGYHIKECVISTNPGAHLWVVSINSVTRVRWCEIVSC
jgi:hypothetical protein